MIFCKNAIYSNRVRPLLYNAYGLIHTLGVLQLNDEIYITNKIVSILKACCKMMIILGINDFRFIGVNDLYNTVTKRLNILIKLS